VTAVDSGLYIPNGIAFSPDGGIVYWADTYMSRRQIWQARRDRTTGEIGEKQPFVTLPEKLGRPDGAAVDAAGCYWVAAVWGWQLLRYTPSGELDLAVRLPVQRPTKLAFGGPDLKTIYITSISDGLGDDAAQAQPLAGHLLAINLGIKGLPSARFRSDRI
jgi:L-arabinonolactonase